MREIPLARGLTVCDSVIVEERTRNLSLINCFTTKRVRRFPANDVRSYVVAFLADGEGDIALAVCIERLDTMVTIWSRSLTLTFHDRIAEVRFFMRIETCVFPVAGPYQIRLLANGEPIAEQRFRIEPLEASS